jgi:hypothetical protein
MPTIENAALRAKFRALMALAPMADYSLDSVVTCRVGKLFADQADERDRLRRRNRKAAN